MTSWPLQLLPKLMDDQNTASLEALMRKFTGGNSPAIGSMGLLRSNMGLCSLSLMQACLSLQAQGHELHLCDSALLVNEFWKSPAETRAIGLMMAEHTTTSHSRALCGQHGCLLMRYEMRVATMVNCPFLDSNIPFKSSLAWNA